MRACLLLVVAAFGLDVRESFSGALESAGSRCEMFHSTDGVCPSVLDCRQGLEDGCATRPFGNEAYGFNLAIIPAPARIRARAHRHLGRAVMYIATSRQCGGEPM